MARTVKVSTTPERAPGPSVTPWSLVMGAELPKLRSAAVTAAVAVVKGYTDAIASAAFTKPLLVLAEALVAVRASVIRSVTVPGRKSPVEVHDWDGRSAEYRAVYKACTDGPMEKLTPKDREALKEKIAYRTSELVKETAPAAEMRYLGLSTASRREKAQADRDRKAAEKARTDELVDVVTGGGAVPLALNLAERASIVVVAVDNLAEWVKTADLSKVAGGDLSQAIRHLGRASDICLALVKQFGDVREGQRSAEKPTEKAPSKARARKPKAA